MRCALRDVWHTDGHLVLQDHEAAAVTGVQAQPRQKLQICRCGVHPLPFFILPGIHIACTETTILSHTPRARLRLMVICACRT